MIYSSPDTSTARSKSQSGSGDPGLTVMIRFVLAFIARIVISFTCHAYQVRTMRKTRILIVEDETIIALDVQGILGGLGYEIAGIAATGHRVLATSSDTCVITFTVPRWAPFYLPICRTALRRLDHLSQRGSC